LFYKRNFRGLINELVSIEGVFISCYAASSYYPITARLLSRWILKIEYHNILGFLTIFLITFIIATFLGLLAKYLLNLQFDRWADRILGAGISITKGIIVISFLLFIFVESLPEDASIISESQMAAYVVPVTKKMTFVVPKRNKNEFGEKIRRYKKVWRNH
jgi:uncharacterized membrane protein required for colicin V production